jgi:hypothetical protein
VWATALEKGAPERTTELLRILNWLAAPFGSADANYVPWKYVVGAPWVFYTPDLPNYARVVYDTEHMLLPSGRVRSDDSDSTRALDTSRTA